MLVYLQNPSVTFFGTTWYWKTKFKRQIKPDAKPHLILAPNGPVILAYDIFDTTGNKTPETFMEEGLNLLLFEVKGDFKDSYLVLLKDYASKLGIKVLDRPLNFFNAGAVTTYVTGKLEIYLKVDHVHSQQFATLCHELAHVFLGHTGHIELLKEGDRKKKINLPIRKDLSKDQMELEAETVNFLICKKLGLDTQSMEYLAGYIEKEGDWKNFSYELVIKVADRLEGELK